METDEFGTVLFLFDQKGCEREIRDVGSEREIRVQ